MNEPWSNALGGGCGLRPLGIGKKGKEKLQEWKKCHEQAKQEGKTFGQKIVHTSAKVSLVVIRGSVLTAARLNLFGIGRRLFPGFATDAQIKAERIKSSSVLKARTAWNKVSTIWKKMGGDPNKLKSELSKGHRLQIKILKKNRNFSGDFENFAGIDDAAVAAYISSGLPVVAAFVTALAEAGADKDPYEAGADPIADGDQYVDGPDASQVSDAEQKSGYTMKNGVPSDNSTGTPLPENSFPVWGWVVIGVGVAGLIGVGLYFAFRKK